MAIRRPATGRIAGERDSIEADSVEEGERFGIGFPAVDGGLGRIWRNRESVACTDARPGFLYVQKKNRRFGCGAVRNRT